jgi:hypothetical protein
MRRNIYWTVAYWIVAYLTYLAAALGTACLAQTAIDLNSQSRSVDFSGFAYTKPVQTGTALPATCSVGQMFFNSAAPNGQNLYGCTAANVWTLKSGGGSGGSVTIDNGSTIVGTRPVLSFSAGLGTLLTTSDTGSAIAIQTSADTSVMTTLAAEQSGGALLCASASGSATTYTCSLSPTLYAYTAGMVLHWQADVSGAGGPTTLNVDTQGVVSVKLPDGATDPGPGDVVAGRIRQIWYDGTVFRLVEPVVPAGILGEALPTCGSTVRGRLWFVAGATGVKDSLSVCAKDSTNTFAWRSLY